jgi:hypothetical protein
VVVLAATLGCSSRRGATAPQAEGELDDPSSCLDAVPATDVAVPEATSGRLAPETIREVIRSRHAELEGCYQLGAGRHPQLGGKVTFMFAIGVEGEVTDLRVADNSMPDCGSVRCMRDVMAQTEFPPPEGGTVAVLYPITFEPARGTTNPAASPQE